MNKKIIAPLLIAFAVLLSSCGSGNKTASDDAKKSEIKTNSSNEVKEENKTAQADAEKEEVESKTYTHAPKDYKSELKIDNEIISKIEKKFEEEYPADYKILKEEYDLSSENVAKIALRFKDALDALKLNDIMEHYKGNTSEVFSWKDLYKSILFYNNDTIVDTREKDYDYFYVTNINLNYYREFYKDEAIVFVAGLGEAGTKAVGSEDVKALKGKTESGKSTRDLQEVERDYKKNIDVLNPSWLLKSGIQNDSLGGIVWKDLRDKPVKLTVLDVEEILLDVYNAKGVEGLRTKLKIEFEGVKPIIQDTFMILPKNGQKYFKDNSIYMVKFPTYAMIYNEDAKKESLDRVSKLRELCVANTFKIKDGKKDHRNAFYSFTRMEQNVERIFSGK